MVAQYPIGANDEPNGHGTVAYKEDEVKKVLKEKGLEDKLAAKKLMAILNISNKVVGDSICNMFVIEAILYDLDMSIQ